MAIRLDLPVAPFWITLRSGIRFHVKPLTALVDGVVREESYAEATRMGEAYRAAKQADALKPDAMDIETPEARTALGEYVYAKVMARHALLDWEGILVGEDNAKAPITPDNIEAAMSVYGMPSDFLLAYTKGMAELQSEKKGSGSALNGSGAADLTTAGAAPAAAPSAPAG
jgi:hypothetical protein